MNRAYSIMSIKAFDDATRIISGTATTPSPDRMGDTVNPLGAKFTLPLPLLWQHNHDGPVGSVLDANPTADGISFRAQLAQTDEPGQLKDFLDFAWQSLKLQLVRAFSIGFAPTKWAFLSDGGIEYDEWEWLELSCVTIPANADCTIDQVKSIDRGYRAALGIPDPVIPAKPRGGAATGKSARVVKLDVSAGVSAPPFVIRDIKRIPR